MLRGTASLGDGRVGVRLDVLLRVPVMLRVSVMLRVPVMLRVSLPIGPE